MGHGSPQWANEEERGRFSCSLRDSGIILRHSGVSNETPNRVTAAKRRSLLWSARVADPYGWTYSLCHDCLCKLGLMWWENETGPLTHFVLTLLFWSSEFLGSLVPNRIFLRLCFQSCFIVLNLSLRRTFRPNTPLLASSYTFLRRNSGRRF